MAVFSTCFSSFPPLKETDAESGRLLVLRAGSPPAASALAPNPAGNADLRRHPQPTSRGMVSKAQSALRNPTEGRGAAQSPKG